MIRDFVIGVVICFILFKVNVSFDKDDVYLKENSEDRYGLIFIDVEFIISYFLFKWKLVLSIFYIYLEI